MVIISCGKNDANRNLPDITQANNVKLSYKSDFDSTGKMKLISKEISDLKTVNEIKKMIDFDPYSIVYCTYTGSMSFYKDSSLIVTMVFNTTPGQKHIAFTYNGKLTALKLSDVNAEFVNNLKN